MPVLWSNNTLNCRPIRIIETSAAGPGDGFLGGEPPRGLRAPVSPELRFFATVPFFSEPEQHLSLFVAELDRLWGVSRRLNPLGLLDVMVHSPAPRGDGSPSKSGLPPYGLRLLGPVEDLIQDDEPGRVVRLGHKIGGRPYFDPARDNTALQTAAEASMSAGFIHVVQFHFPGDQDAPVDGEWPFHTGTFNLLGKPPFLGPGDWLWFWTF